MGWMEAAWAAVALVVGVRVPKGAREWWPQGDERRLRGGLWACGGWLRGSGGETAWAAAVVLLMGGLFAPWSSSGWGAPCGGAAPF